MFIVLVIVAIVGWAAYANKALLIADFKKDFAKVDAAVGKLDTSVKAEVAAAVAEIKKYL